MPPRMPPRASGSLLRRAAQLGQRCSSSTAAAAGKPGITPQAATAALVRTSDHPAHLAAAFYPAALRPHYLALRAFNVETATIKDNVSNETLGRIRVGWWRDAVRGAFDVRAHAADCALPLTCSVRTSPLHTRRSRPCAPPFTTRQSCVAAA